MIAGGLGERLGYSGIKVALPVSIIEKNYSYMMYYAQYVLACEERAKKLNPNLGSDFYVPLGIMVSDDTNDRTKKLLEDNNYFGLQKSQVFMLK